MKNKKLILLIAFCVVLLGLGVSQMHFGFDEKDAEIFADDLMKITTGCDLDTIDASKYWDIDSLEELKESLEEEVDEGLDIQLRENNNIKLTEEDKVQLKELVIKAMSKVKYSIGAATKTEEGYAVPITIEPVKLYAGINEGLGEVTVEYINENGIDDKDSDDLVRVIFLKYMSNIDGNLDEPQYAAPEEKTLHIQKDEKFYYGLEEDAKKIGEVLFSTEADIPNATPESMKKRTEKLLNSAETGELDSSLDPLDIITAAVYYDGIQDVFDEIVTDESNDRIKYLDEEGRQDYRTYLETVFEMVNYEIIEAEENDEGYEVTVRKSVPDNDSFFDKVDDETIDYLKTQDIDSDITDEDLNKIIYREEVDRLLSGVKSIEYKEPETYTVKYIKSEIGTYDLDQDSIGELLKF